MISEKRIKTAKLLSLIVIISGAAVIIGWIFNIPVLKSISPAWESMKLDTAIVFVASGIVLYFMARAKEGELDRAQVAISIASLIITLIMGTLFFSSVFKIRTGTEELFIREIQPSAKTAIPGMPSLPTIINFILIAITGVAHKGVWP